MLIEQNLKKSVAEAFSELVRDMKRSYASKWFFLDFAYWKYNKI